MIDKETKPKKSDKSPLDKFELWLEKDNFPPKYISPTAGKGEHWLKRGFKTTIYIVLMFVLEVIAAIKEIIRRVTK